MFYIIVKFNQSCILIWSKNKQRGTKHFSKVQKKYVQWQTKPSTIVEHFHSNNHSTSIDGQSAKVWTWKL